MPGERVYNRRGQIVDCDWWFNSDETPDFGFTVTTETGADLAADGVAVAFYCLPSNELLQASQTVSPDEVDGNHYVVNLGTAIPQTSTGISMEVTATNIYGDFSVNTQSYGIDNNAPTIVFVSPEADE